MSVLYNKYCIIFKFFKVIIIKWKIYFYYFKQNIRIFIINPNPPIPTMAHSPPFFKYLLIGAYKVTPAHNKGGVKLLGNFSGILNACASYP